MERLAVDWSRRMRVILCVGIVVGTASTIRAQTTPARPPIIDVHLHAYAESDWTGRPPNPATNRPGPASAAEHMRATLAEMEKYNIVSAIVSGPLEAVEQWRTAAPDRILASPLFGRPGFEMSGRALPVLESFRGLYRERRLK